MNNKGFTLIELLASIILLAIIMSITTVFVINIIQDSKEKSYDLLVSNIKIGAQEYFEECENKNIIDSSLPDSACNNLIKNSGCSETQVDKCATMNLGTLLRYGFLISSATDNNGNKIVENPITNNNMNTCNLEIMKFVDDTNYSTWYKIISKSTYSYCPKTEEYVNAN